MKTSGYSRCPPADRLQRILLLVIVLTVIGWGVYDNQQSKWRTTLNSQLVFNTLFTQRVMSDQFAKNETSTPQDIVRALAGVSYGDEKEAALIKEVSKLPWLERARILSIPLYGTLNVCTLVMYPYDAHINKESPEQIRAVWIFQKNRFCEQLPFATIPKGVIFDQAGKITHWLFKERAADYIYLVNKLLGTHRTCDVFGANCQKVQTIVKWIKVYVQKRIFATYPITPIFTKVSVLKNIFIFQNFSGDLAIVPYHLVNAEYGSLIKEDDFSALENLQRAAEREKERVRGYYGDDTAEFGGMKLTRSLMFYFPFLGITTMLYIVTMGLFYVKQLRSLQPRVFFSLTSTFADRAWNTLMLRCVWVITPILSVISWLLIFQSFYGGMILYIPFTSIGFYFEFLELDFEILNEYSYFPLPWNYQGPDTSLLTIFALVQIYLLILAVKLTRDIYRIVFSRKKIDQAYSPYLLFEERKEK